MDECSLWGDRPVDDAFYFDGACRAGVSGGDADMHASPDRLNYGVCGRVVLRVGECAVGDLDASGGSWGMGAVKVPFGRVVASCRGVTVLLSDVCWSRSSVAPAIGCSWLLRSWPVILKARCV